MRYVLFNEGPSQMCLVGFDVTVDVRIFFDVVKMHAFQWFHSCESIHPVETEQYAFIYTMLVKKLAGQRESSRRRVPG